MSGGMHTVNVRPGPVRVPARASTDPSQHRTLDQRVAS